MRVAVADAMRRSWTRPLATVALPVCLDPLLAHRKVARPQTRPGALRVARAGAGAGGKQRAGRAPGRQQNRPSVGHRRRFRGRSRGWRAGARSCATRTSASLKDWWRLTTSWWSWRAQRQLPPDATGGSIATVTNFGTFGLTWATPIPLPEQTPGAGHGRRHGTQPSWDAERTSSCRSWKQT